MNFTANSLSESSAILLDSYTKDGLTIRTYSPDINEKKQTQKNIQLSERIKKVINETKL